MRELIVDIMQEIVDATSAEVSTLLQSVDPNYTGVRFDYGFPDDLFGRIEAMSSTEDHRYSAYPLIGLLLGFDDSRNKTNQVTSSIKVNMFVCMQTLPEYIPQERTDRSFRPILVPIVDAFIGQVLRSPKIITPENSLIQYNEKHEYKWGVDGVSYWDGSKKNVFNDHIDAITITGLELEFGNNIC
jgi:hypothetical protein